MEETSNTGLEFLPYKFTAKELDKETGLYYYGASILTRNTAGGFPPTRSTIINFLGDRMKEFEKKGKENDLSRTFKPEEVSEFTVKSWLEDAKKEFGEPSQWNSCKENEYEENI